MLWTTYASISFNFRFIWSIESEITFFVVRRAKLEIWFFLILAYFETLWEFASLTVVQTTKLHSLSTFRTIFFSFAYIGTMDCAHTKKSMYAVLQWSRCGIRGLWLEKYASQMELQITFATKRINNGRKFLWRQKYGNITTILNGTNKV